MSHPVGSRFECLRCGKLWTVRPYEPARDYKCRDCSAKLAPSRKAGPAGDYYPPELARVLKHRPRRLGPFLLGRRIGRGGSARVFRAWDDEVRRWVAIKVLRPDAAVDADGLARFRREAQIAANAPHPNIVPIFQVSEAKGRRFMAMQWIDGETLARRRFPGWRDVLKAMIDVCDGVAFLHRNGIVHRDLKPQNIMIDREGKIFVMDFGLARSLDAGVTTEGKIVGTPGYMSPEQAQGNTRKVDARTDVYALGVTIHTLVTGQAPHESSTDEGLVGRLPAARGDRRLPRALEAVVRKATAAAPVDRHRDAAELGRALSALLRSDGEKKLSPKTAAVVLAGLLALGVVAAAFGRHSWKKRRASEEPVVASPSRVAPNPADERAALKRPDEEETPKNPPKPDLWTDARHAREQAEGLNTVALWKRYVEIVEGLVDADPEQARAALDYGRQRMHERGAQEAEANGDLAEAVRLAELALAAKKTAEGETYLAQLKRKKARADAYAAKMAEGERALQETDPGKAEKAFTEALEARENDPAARDGQKRARKAQGDRLYDAAMADAKKAAGEKRWADAKKAALRALDARPDDPAARNLLREAEREAEFEGLLAKARSLAKSKKFDEALAAVEDALRLKDGDAAALGLKREIVADACKADIDKGDDFAKARDWKSSEAAYASALKRNPKDKDAKTALEKMKGDRAVDPPAFEKSELWPLESKDRRNGKAVKAYDGAVRDAAFSPDQTLLAVALEDGTVRLLDVKSGKEAQSLQGRTGKVTCVAFRHDGKFLAAGGDDHLALVWSIAQKGTELTQPFESKPAEFRLSGGVRSVAFHPTLNCLAIAAASGQDVHLVFFKGEIGQDRLLKRNTGETWGVAFSPDGKRLFSSVAANLVNVWDPVSLEWLGELKGMRADVLGFPPADPVPDESKENKASKEYKENKAERDRAIQENERKSRLLFLMPALKDTNAQGGQDVQVQLWKDPLKADLKDAQPLPGHTGRPLTGVFSKDGSVLVTSGEDGELFFWDVADLKKPRAHWSSGQGKVHGLALSPDGRLLISCGDKGTLKVWHAPK